MNSKRNVLSLVVAGSLVTIPMAAMAEPEVYGLVDVGIEVYDDNDNMGVDIFPGLNSVAGNSDDRAFTLSNGMSSRLGVRGDEQIDRYDLTASYNIELQIDVLNDGSNRNFTRLGWAALGNEWGQVKVGAQWMALYEFGGWNTFRNDVHGYGAYYYTTSLLGNSLEFGFRQDSVISYQYGSAWDHSDPFAFNVSLGIGEGDDNEEGISSLTVAGQYSYNQQVSVNGVYVAEYNSTPAANDREPQLYNVGGRYSVTDALEFAVNYMIVDVDDDEDSLRTALSFATIADLGWDLTGLVGIANGQDDRDSERQIDLNLYGYLRKALSDRTNVRVELETIQYEAGDDAVSVGLVAIQHNF